MKRISRFISIILWLELISACALPPELAEDVTQITSIPQPAFTQTISTATATMEPAVPIPQSTGDEFNPIITSRVQPDSPTTYILNVLFDEHTKQLEVYETIDYLNQTGVVLERLPLEVPPNSAEGQFELHTLGVGENVGENDEVGAYTLEGGHLSLDLPVPLEPDERVTVQLQYVLHLMEQPGVLGYTWRQVNVCNWYAFVPPYQPGSGWMVNDYHSIGEYLVYDTADFDVGIRLKQANPDLIVVGSVPGQRSDTGWQFHADGVRTFVWTASEEYEILTLEEYPDITAYVFPCDMEAGWAALTEAASARDLYSEVYGEPTQDHVFLIEADFYDGMEYDGLFFLGYDYFERYGGDEKDYLTAIAVHEMAHQWWFAAVGNDAANEPWLDESLATYSELVFYEAAYPEDGEWWWDYRVEWFQPHGCVDSTIYQYETTRPYINAVYLRGVKMIDAIRELMGDEAFFAFLRAYYQAGTGQIMTGEDFFSIAVEHTDADIERILWRYFER